ncbi:MAG: hypothetical protein Q9195_006586 [Heterodermia aff. obscurata]
MELQARRNSPEAEGNALQKTSPLAQALQGTSSLAQAAQTATSLREFLPQITEFATESSLSTTGVLKDRCDVCSQNLQACIVAVNVAVLANSNTLEKVKLRDLQARLQEHEIRFGIWKSDCNISERGLSAIDDDRDGSLYHSINKLFIRMDEALKQLFSQMDHLQGPAIEAASSPVDDPRGRFDQFDQAEQRAQTACDNMTGAIHDLAELQPNIQIAQAVYLNEGPYANIQETVDQISKKYLDNEDNESDAAEEKEEEPTSVDQRCSRCEKAVPYHALAYHNNSCAGPVKYQSSDQEVISSPGDTPVAAAGPENQRYQTLPDKVIPTPSDIQKRRDQTSTFHSQGKTLVGSTGPEEQSATTIPTNKSQRRGSDHIIGSEKDGKDVYDYVDRTATTTPTNISKGRKPDRITRARKDGDDVYNYVNQIVRHSHLQVQDSLHAGLNYARLASYLSKPKSPIGQFDTRNVRREANLAWTENLTLTDGTGRLEGTIYTYFQSRERFRNKQKLRSPRHVSEEVSFAQERDGMAFLIFLCGNPSPLSLAGLAVACHLDPEYLRQHLSSVMENRAGSDTSHFANLTISPANDFTLPSLPSASYNIVQLRYTSIGRSVPHGKQRQTDSSGTSESLVRDIFSWENGYVSVEQQISICVEHLPAQSGKQGSWLGFIWIDSGNGASSRFLGEPLKNVEFLPTILFRRKIALEITGDQEPHDYSVSQTAQLLHTCYGRETDPELARMDAFYAFHEIFEFCAFSEVQFLNFMEKQVEQYQTDEFMEHGKFYADASNLSIRSLNRYRMIVERHISQLEMTLEVIRRKGSREWPRSVDFSDRRTSDVVRQLEGDFGHLLSQAKTIGQKLDDSLSQAIHGKNRSQKATTQANYTKLAFALVLIAILIFTTSFFSMNFKELQDISVWIYFVVSTPLLLGLTTVFIFWSKLNEFASSSNRKTKGREPSTSMPLDREKTENSAKWTRFKKRLGLYRRGETVPV